MCHKVDARTRRATAFSAASAGPPPDPVLRLVANGSTRFTTTA